MNIIRGWEDIVKISEKTSVIIWGAGNLGHRLLQEIRVNGLKNVYIYDENDLKTNDMKERITLQQIKCEMDEFVAVIAVADENIADEISIKILMLNEKAQIFRYAPKDGEYLKQKLKEQGFYNGVKSVKALDDFNARKMLEEKINNEEPFLCSRWGSVEGNAVYADLSGIFTDNEIFSLKNNAGFYPLDKESIHKFVEYSINAAKEIDVLAAGCWCIRIEELYRFYSPNAVLINSPMMCPVWENIAWTRSLKGKKVLVIHPFAKLMEKQYVHHDKLFESADILPQIDLKVYQAVQSMNGSLEFESWFDALEKMENDISMIDFDVALIGCGAYGMPLGAFIKSKLHKKAIHMGGALQLLFGIKGKRWEHENFNYQYKLYNEYWVRPTDDLKPKNYKQVENGCYW